MNGFYLSEIDGFISNPAVNYSGYYYGLKSGILTSEVTALLTTNLIIFMSQLVSSSIFLQFIRGTSILNISLMRC